MKKLTEQRNATRASGRFARMPACGTCGRRGTLEPAFGGDSSHGADQTKWWGKLICPKCAAEAQKSIHP